MLNSWLCGIEIYCKSCLETGPMIINASIPLVCLINIILLKLPINILGVVVSSGSLLAH